MNPRDACRKNFPASSDEAGPWKIFGDAHTGQQLAGSSGCAPGGTMTHVDWAPAPVYRWRPELRRHRREQNDARSDIDMCFMAPNIAARGGKSRAIGKKELSSGSGASRRSDSRASPRACCGTQGRPRGSPPPRPPDLETLLVDGERPADGGRRVDDDHRRSAGVRVDVRPARQDACRARTPRALPDCGGRQRFAAIDVAARKHPLAVAGLDRAADEHDAPVARSMIVPTATFGSR